MRDRHLRPAADGVRGRAARGHDRRLRRGAGGGVLPRGRVQREDDPARPRPLRLQRPPHDRGSLQGLRARPAPGRLRRSRRDGRALDQGHPDREMDHSDGHDRDSRLRDGEPPLGGEGARARRRRGPDHERAGAVLGADGVVLPGVGAFPKAMERIHELGLDRADQGSPGGRHPGAGDLPGPAAPVRAPRSRATAPRAWDCCRHGRAARGRRPQGPAHRLVAGPLGARVEADRGPRPGAALLLRALVHAPAGLRGRRARHRRLRRALRLRRRAAAPSTAPSSTRRSPARPGCACSQNFASICSA